MADNFNFDENIEISWCAGCGNYSIIESIKAALRELGLSPQNVVIASGIGQAAKMPQYINTNFFNGLHGRALPVATAIKASNPKLTVIAEGGDGDMYGEGGNHFIHTIRRNPDITNIVHNNMVYGLTKGQASPTSRIGFKTPLQVNGVVSEPFNPLAVAISLNATFVARTFSGDVEETKEIIKAAILHKGYALVDVFHPCVSFNKINNFKWYKDNTYRLPKEYDPTDRENSLKIALDEEKFALGIIYKNENRKTFEENLGAYRENSIPIVERSGNSLDFKKLLSE